MSGPSAPRNSSRRAKPTDKTRRRLLALAKARARRLHVPFTITLADVRIPARCPALGIPLRVGQGIATYQSPTLDRLVAAMGYVPGNVSVISHRANSIKHNASIGEMESIVAYCRCRIMGGIK